MTFIRFVLNTPHPDTGVADGVFGLAYKLLKGAGLENVERGQLREAVEWFEQNLPTPDRFNRSKSKGYYRRATRGIHWFRDSATECLTRMHQIKDVLESHGHPVTIIRESRIGYLVYEDQFQVVAEPFADTHTGG